VLNLWHITDNEKELYGQYVKEYLQNHFWKKKDLTSVQSSITEACYNTLDHSNAEGNAFSFIKYDRDSHLLGNAVCDFGIGIAESVKSVYPELSDEDALLKAIEVKFTIKSKSYNSGMGLDIIKSSVTDDKNMVIISNRAFLIADNQKEISRPLEFSFPGTLLSYDINLSKYDDDEERLYEVSLF